MRKSDTRFTTMNEQSYEKALDVAPFVILGLAAAFVVFLAAVSLISGSDTVWNWIVAGGITLALAITYTAILIRLRRRIQR